MDDKEPITILQPTPDHKAFEKLCEPFLDQMSTLGSAVVIGRHHSGVISIGFSKGITSLDTVDILAKGLAGYTHQLQHDKVMNALNKAASPDSDN
jgi:hypothetical protein